MIEEKIKALLVVFGCILKPFSVKAHPLALYVSFQLRFVFKRVLKNLLLLEPQLIGIFICIRVTILQSSFLRSSCLSNL